MYSASLTRSRRPRLLSTHHSFPSALSTTETTGPSITSQELLSSYNLGLDPDERNKRMVEATARRVGFALPTEEKPPPRKRGGQQEGQQEGQLQREERSSGAPGGLPEARAATNG